MLEIDALLALTKTDAEIVQPALACDVRRIFCTMSCALRLASLPSLAGQMRKGGEFLAPLFGFAF